MPNYKRLFIQNSYVFLTIVTNYRCPILIDNIEILREAFKNTKMNYDFEIIAGVVLPNHLHTIIEPKDINEYPKIIHSVKYYFSKNTNAGGIVIPPYELNKSKINKGEKGIWQRRYFEHTIINEDDLNKHIDYIHYNPVKHGHVKNVKDWNFSSFHRFVKKNLYEENWGSENIEKFSNLYED